jgi:hypothetical protein
MSADALFKDMLDECVQGQFTAPRGMGTRDVAGYLARVMNPRARRVLNPVRDVRLGYPAASVAWNLALRNDVDGICWWNENGRRVSDDGSTFHGANYGQRWDRPLSWAINLLRKDPDTRRAWVPIYDWQKDGHLYSASGNDVPCTLGFGLRLASRQSKHDSLDMSVIMRSQSAYGVFPYDFYLFAVMQELIANSLGVRLGQIFWHCLSLHVYDRELDGVTEARKWYDDSVGSPQYRTMHVEMPAITYTLEQAKTRYHQCFQEVMDSKDIGLWRADQPVDPVMLELLQGAEAIHAALSAPA